MCRLRLQGVPTPHHRHGLDNLEDSGYARQKRRNIHHRRLWDVEPGFGAYRS